MSTVTAPPNDWGSASKTRHVVAAVGGTRAAALMLDVAPSQVSRWASGTSAPSMDTARRLIDLEHVVAHIALVWGDPGGVQDWLTTPNGFLGGIAPIDWIRVHGTADVVEAIRAEGAGGFA